MAKIEISINMDAKCKKCGKLGALDSGYCLKCIADRVGRLPRGVSDDS